MLPKKLLQPDNFGNDNGSRNFTAFAEEIMVMEGVGN